MSALDSVEGLELRNGERVTAAHVDALDRRIARNGSRPGVRVRRVQRPWGTSFCSSAIGGVGDSPIFRPAVDFRADGTAEVRWSGPRALIGSVAPTIGKAEIFAEDAQTGLRPALVVSPTLYGKETSECLVYFKVTTWPDFTAKTVTPVALAARPAAEAYTAYKLALFLRKRDGAPSYLEEDDRVMFCGQALLAIQRRPSGKFEALFSATF